jgi:hypothetical protein
VASLVRVGVHDPESIVDTAFATKGEEYHRMILEKAMELALKPASIRNETAKLVEDANGRVESSTIASQLSKKLAEGGRRILTPAVKETAALDGTFGEKTVSLLAFRKRS